MKTNNYTLYLLFALVLSICMENNLLLAKNKETSGKKQKTEPVKAQTKMFIKTMPFQASEQEECSFKPEFTYGISGTKLFLRNLTSGQYEYIKWDFGDGTTVTDEEKPEHNYESVGKYTFTLHITNDKGCTQARSGEVFIVDTSPLLALSPIATKAIPLSESIGQRLLENIISENIGAARAASKVKDVINFDVKPDRFKEGAQISFTLTTFTHIKVHVTDMGGRSVQVLTAGEKKDGHYKFTFNRGDLPNGLYFVSVTTTNQSFSERISL